MLRFSSSVARVLHLGLLGALVVANGCGGGEKTPDDAMSGSGGTNASGSSGSGTHGGTAGAGGTSVAGAPGGTAGANAGTGSAGVPGSGGSGTTAGSGGSIASGGAGAGGTGAGGASSGGTGGSEVTGEITDLKIEANPHSVLSAYVKWTTAEPSSSVVEFGTDQLVWQIEGAPMVTEHEVLVIGMRAETEYQIRALSTGASGTVAGTSTFTTGTLPAQIPVGTVSVHDAAKAQPGWTLLNVQKGDGTNRAYSGAPPAAVIYDEAGHPVWYFINGARNERGGAITVDPTDKGVLMGPSLSAGMNTPPLGPTEADWGGNIVWSCADPLCGVPDQLSHHAGKLSNGNYIVMRDANMSGGRISQVFIELSPEGQMVRSVGIEDLMTPPQGASGDWAHGNSITVDLENDVAYLSFRWLGVLKVKYSTKELLWHLPAAYGQNALNSNFGDMSFVPADSQFSDIHDPEIHDDGTILFFDNGGFSGVIEDGNPGNRQTRAVEYRIDEAAKTATLEWEWPGNFDVDPWYKSELYVPFWGDADRLANGNVLIAAGRRGTAASTPESRVIEVEREGGQVVWELRLPKDHGVYRAERLYPLPLLKKLE